MNSESKWQSVSDLLNTYHGTGMPDFTTRLKKIVFYRIFFGNFLTFLMQYVGLMLFGMANSESFIPVWLANGVTCGFVFLRGFCVLPGIFFGSVLAYYFATHEIQHAVTSAAILTGQIALLAWLCFRYISPSLVFYDKKKFSQFVLCTFVLTAIASWMLDSFAVLRTTWLANFSGLLIFSCAIVTWDFYFPALDEKSKQEKVLMLAYYGLFIVLLLFLLCSHHYFYTIMLSLATFALSLLFSYKYKWCGVIAALSIYALGLDLAVYLKLPLFAHEIPLTLTYLQNILLVISISSLYLSTSSPRLK